MARKTKSYFFDAPDNSDGRKFSRFNHPTKEEFQNLFDSVPFKLDAADTAQEEIAGHIKAATDNDVISRKYDYKDKHNRAVMPYQIPGLIVGSTEVLTVPMVNPEDGLIVTPTEVTLPDGKTRTSYKLKVSPSRGVTTNADGSIALKGDIEDNTLGASNGLFYGVMGGARGYYRAVPVLAPGALKTRLDVNGDREMYWDAKATDPSFGSGLSLLVNTYNSISLPASPSTPVLKTYQHTRDSMKTGSVLKIKGVFLMAANNGQSSAFLRVRIGAGNICDVPLANVTDGNTNGYVSLEAEISLLGSSGVDNVIITGKAFNAAIPSEVYLNHYHAWSFTGDTGDMYIEMCGSRLSGSSEVTAHKFTIEKVI